MTTITLPTTNRIFQTGCNTSLPSFYTQQPYVREDSYCFTKSFLVMFRVDGETIPIYASLGSGEMHGLTKEGLSEALYRSRTGLARHSGETEEHANHRKEAETRTIAEQLRDARKAFGLNTSDLAALLGVSRPTLIHGWMVKYLGPMRQYEFLG